MKNIQNAESKILPWVQISPAAHFALMESCWGVPSPNPANIKTGSTMILVMCFLFCLYCFIGPPSAVSVFVYPSIT